MVYVLARIGQVSAIGGGKFQAIIQWGTSEQIHDKTDFGEIGVTDIDPVLTDSEIAVYCRQRVAIQMTEYLGVEITEAQVRGCNV